jgi:hypothetical protein
MRYIAQTRHELKQRMLTGKKLRYTAEERESLQKKKQEIRDKFESNNCGDFHLIYPPKDPEL